MRTASGPHPVPRWPNSPTESWSRPTPCGGGCIDPATAGLPRTSSRDSWMAVATAITWACSGMRISAPAFTIAVALASSRGPNPSSGCPGAHPAGAQAIPAEAPEVAGVELPTATTSSTTASSAASAAAAAPAIPARPISRPTCVTCVRAPAAPGSPREQSAATPCPQHGRRTADDCDRFRFRRYPAAIRVSRDGLPRSSSGKSGPTGLTPACQRAALPGPAGRTAVTKEGRCDRTPSTR